MRSLQSLSMNDNSGAVFAAARAPEHDLNGENDAVARIGGFTARDAVEEQVCGDAAHLLRGLADNCERR
jgi:hypothetical protein